jgi:heptosyltransferase-2
MKLMIEELRQLDVDCIIAPHRSFRTTIISKLSRAKYTVGFDKSSFSSLYDRTIKYQHSKHEISRDYSLLKAFDGIRLGGAGPLANLTIAESDSNAIDSMLKKENIARAFVALAPGSIWATKKWPKEKFLELAKLIIDSGNDCILIGADSDKKACSYIAEGSGAISLAGRTTVPQTLALLKKAGGLITNDSAPAHFAGLVACPVLTIFGATSPKFGFAPIGEKSGSIGLEGLSCRPCRIHGSNSCPKKHFKCMMELEAMAVYERYCEIVEIK